ncbi:MAG: hypothetical protein HZC29_01410 [Thaumarchaeota archaeon]|nr:hypothetical protein [Candidatus Woesearchaeota archaeon]MBI5697165.1 hypothetical protein [Nitrososphaerota archaeon]
MRNKKILFGIIAGSLLSLSTLKGANANPVASAYVVEAPAPPNALQPFYEYTCGDPKLPTAYYFFDVHYDTERNFRMADVYLQDPKDPGYEKNRKVAEQYRKVAEEGLTCQEQIYLTMQQLQQERKISVGFIEGLHQGDSVEEGSLVVHFAREVFQTYGLGELVETFKTGLTAFATTEQFPVFGWESMNQEEYITNYLKIFIKKIENYGSISKRMVLIPRIKVARRHKIKNSKKQLKKEVMQHMTIHFNWHKNG